MEDGSRKIVWKRKGRRARRRSGKQGSSKYDALILNCFLFPLCVLSLPHSSFDVCLYTLTDMLCPFALSFVSFPTSLWSIILLIKITLLLVCPFQSSSPKPLSFLFSSQKS